MVKETETETKGRKIAEHELIDLAGAAVEDEESADGISYTLLGNGETFVWNFSEATDDEKRMLAIFGAKTLATNETSQVRNSKQGAFENDFDAQIKAVRDRFTLIRNEGKWVDRTREGGIRVNRDLLAEAICIVLVRLQKKSQDEVDNGHKAAVRQKLEDDADYLKKARNMPDVAAEYSRLAARASTTTVDDLAV